MKGLTHTQAERTNHFCDQALLVGKRRGENLCLGTEDDNFSGWGRAAAGGLNANTNGIIGKAIGWQGNLLAINIG